MDDTIETETQDQVREERVRYRALREGVEFLVEDNEVVWTQIRELKDEQVLLLAERDRLNTDLEELGEQNLIGSMVRAQYLYKYYVKVLLVLYTSKVHVVLLLDYMLFITSFRSWSIGGIRGKS